MVETVVFGTFLTKGIEISKEEAANRVFTGHITSEIVDKQDEIIAQSEVAKIMDTFMSINPVISDSHSNRMVGKVLSYEKSEIEGHPSIKIKAQIYKNDKVTLYDKVWDKIVSKEYCGFSMGGASKSKEMVGITKDGAPIIKLADLELYEIAVCKTPANQLALIDYVNTFAKTNHMEDKIVTLEDGRQIIKCNGIRCSFEKASMYKCGSCGKEYPEPFDKCGSCGAMKKTEEGGIGGSETRNEAETPRGANEDKDNDTDNTKPKETPLAEIGIEKLLEAVMKATIKIFKEEPIKDDPEGKEDEIDKDWDSMVAHLQSKEGGSHSKESADKIAGMINAKYVHHYKATLKKIAKYLMTEAEHDEHYKPKEEAKEKENNLTVPSKDPEDKLVKLIQQEIMKNEIRSKLL